VTAVCVLVEFFLDKDIAAGFAAEGDHGVDVPSISRGLEMEFGRRAWWWGSLNVLVASKCKVNRKLRPAAKICNFHVSLTAFGSIKTQGNKISHNELRFNINWMKECKQTLT